MSDKRYSPLHNFAQGLISSTVGARFLYYSAHHVDRFIFRLTRKRASLGNLLTGLPVILLTTTGAKTGLSRTSPVLGIYDPEQPNQIAVIATNWGQKNIPGWYYNLKANPRAKLDINGHGDDFIAHEAEMDEYQHYWQRAQEVYKGFILYKQRAQHRRIPIMVLVQCNQVH